MKINGTQECRDCGAGFPYDPEFDRCGECVGEMHPDSIEVEGRTIVRLVAKADRRDARQIVAKARRRSRRRAEDRLLDAMLRVLS